MSAHCEEQRHLGWTLATSLHEPNGPLTRYVNLRIAHASGMPGTFPHHWFQRKPLVCDPGIHDGTCVTHVAWYMPGSLICDGGKYVPGIPGACATCNFTYLARGPCTTLCASDLHNARGAILIILPKIWCVLKNNDCSTTVSVNCAIILHFDTRTQE